MRHELLSIKAEPASVVHQELPQVDSTTIYSKCYVGSEFQDGSTLKDALYQSERSVSISMYVILLFIYFVPFSIFI